MQERVTSIICDNQGSITLAKNPAYHLYTKHIDVQHHVIREKMEKGEICLKNRPTEDMIANVLTITLTIDRHQGLTRAMGLQTFDYLQSGSVKVKALGCS